MLKPVVLDTNLVVSAFLVPDGAASRALEIAVTHFEAVYSTDTMAELADVLSRAKFDRYLERDLRKSLLLDYVEASKQIEVSTKISDCKDPKDNKFLALAIDAGAHLLVSGDKRHLLALHPYRGIHMLGLRSFIDSYQLHLN